MLYSKGMARHERLIDAALELLGEHPLRSISLRDIAAAAGIPPASSYHYFSNVDEVFTALANRFGDKLIAAITAPYPPAETNSWQELYRAAVGRGVEIYRATPAYCRLILGPHTLPAIKLSDRENDERLGFLFADVLARYFKLPDIPEFGRKVFYSIEIADLFLCLSFIYHGEIKKDMVEEASRAATAYLNSYLPSILPRRPADIE